MTERAALRKRLGAAAGAAALGLVVIGGTVGKVSAAASWPRATYYTVVARPGDTVAEIAASYHVPASAVGRLNEINAATRLVPGRILRIPAATLATRNAVLSEAGDR